MTDSDENSKPRSEGQQFLIGEALYLRPVEPEDAETATIWRKSPFPAPKEVVEEQLKEQLSGDLDSSNRDWHLVACRRNDDRPVGSVFLHFGGWRYADVTFQIDRFLDDAAKVGILTELLGILVPWHLDEQNLQTVFISVPGNLRAIESKVAEFGGYQCYRMREKLFLDGSRQDEYCYEILHPKWVEQIGKPKPIVEGPVEREVKSPAPKRWPAVVGDASNGAIMVGERIYLRAFDPDEDKLVSKWSLQEPEIYYSFGRLISKPHRYGELHKKLAKKDPPSWTRFAIVLKENDELIGANGLCSIDWVSRTAETETEIFRSEHRSSGLGTEAKHLLLDYGFER